MKKFLNFKEFVRVKILKTRFWFNHYLDRLKRQIFLPFETWKYSRVIPKENQFFWIVSCERNARCAAIKCIDSIFNQSYEKKLVRHLFIDDASTDDTDSLLRNWLKQHPDHNVEYISQRQRAGGTANTVMGFRMAPPGSIVLEVNGDDWLPDSEVLNFLNKVYDDPEVWMTYNTFMYSDGRSPEYNHPYPKRVVENGDYKKYEKWVGQPLHSFRAELFSCLREETFIDPETRKYWKSTDDQAIYLSMLELAGKHAKHIYRTTYIYNYHDLADDKVDPAGSADRAARIREVEKYLPLGKL